MKYWIQVSCSFLLFLVVFSACEQEKQQYSDAQLVEIVIDAQILESASNHLSGKLRDSISGAYYQALFKKHNLEKAQFQQIINDLSINPTKAKKIYSIASDSLTAMQKRANQ
jgi:hypothetical protein